MLWWKLYLILFLWETLILNIKKPCLIASFAVHRSLTMIETISRAIFTPRCQRLTVPYKRSASGSECAIRIALSDNTGKCSERKYAKHVPRRKPAINFFRRLNICIIVFLPTLCHTPCWSVYNGVYIMPGAWCIRRCIGATYTLKRTQTLSHTCMYNHFTTHKNTRKLDSGYRGKCKERRVLRLNARGKLMKWFYRWICFYSPSDIVDTDI